MLNGYAFTKRLEEYKQVDLEKNKEQWFKNKHVVDRNQLA